MREGYGVDGRLFWHKQLMDKRWIRVVGAIMIVAGVLGAVWVLVVWRWKDPFTSLYTLYRQHQLSGEYDDRSEAWRRREPPASPGASVASVRQSLAAEAGRYRRSSKRGEPIGKIAVPRLGLDIFLVNGTDEGSLEKGPGRDLRTYMPGQGELVYIAGHRTTFLAPFADIDRMRRGDPIVLTLPYATFRYSVTGHTIVPADDVARLRSHGREVVTLQACHPRFFATKRYLVYGRPVSVELSNGRVYSYGVGGRLTTGSAPASLRVSPRTAVASPNS
jgi:sortase A